MLTQSPTHPCFTGNPDSAACLVERSPERSASTLQAKGSGWTGGTPGCGWWEPGWYAWSLQLNPMALTDAERVSCKGPGSSSELPGRKCELPGRKGELPDRKCELPGRKGELPVRKGELSARSGCTTG